MEKRQIELRTLQSYIKDVDKEVTMVLQNLQWDRNTLIKRDAMVRCKYDTNHSICPKKKDIHERDCLLKQHGYTKQDIMLPDPPNINARTLIKFNNEEIQKIIDEASKINPLFIKGCGNQGLEPLTVERLQATYTSDELCAIHDAVVKAVPSCHDLADLALPSVISDEQKNSKPKSRMEILAELRDMKRRRAKYRVAAKTRNYSDVLRDVIKTQMEHYSDVSTNKSSECTNKVNETKSDKDYDQMERSSFKSDDSYLPKGQNKYIRASEDRYEDKRCKGKRKYEDDYKTKQNREGREIYGKRHKDRSGDEVDHKKQSHSRERTDHKRDYYKISGNYTKSERVKHSNTRNRSSHRKDYDNRNDRKYCKERSADSRQERYTYNESDTSSTHKRSHNEKYDNCNKKNKYMEDNGSSDRLYKHKRYYDT